MLEQEIVQQLPALLTDPILTLVTEYMCASLTWPNHIHYIPAIMGRPQPQYHISTVYTYCAHYYKK